MKGANGEQVTLTLLIRLWDRLYFLMVLFAVALLRGRSEATAGIFRRARLATVKNSVGVE